MRIPFLCIVASVLLLAWLPRAEAQNVTVSGAIIGNGNYATLSAAFTAINPPAIQTGSNILITISASFSEVQFVNVGAGSWATVTVQPSGGSARTITSNFVPLLELNGARNVTIDGLNSGGNSLTLDNNSASTATAAIRFINDATNNVVTRCTLKSSCQGQNTSGDGAVVWFFTSFGTTGNDNNTISFCDITGSSLGRPSQGIRSDGSTPAKSNDNIIITNNNIYDFGSTASAKASNGINAGPNSKSWTITNNRIYQTSTLSFGAGQFEYRAINVNTAGTTGGGGFTITGNIIGYSNSSGTGNTVINTGANMVYGILFDAPASGGTNSTITGNIIANIDQSTSRSPTLASSAGQQVFVGIFIETGPATVSNNIIGSTSATGSISIHTQQSTVSTSTCVVGILNLGSNNNTISNNQIGGIAIAWNSGIAQTESFAGIKNESTGTVTISGNTIGGSIADCISSNQLAANLIGIYSTSSPVTISNNTIQNLNHTGVNSGTGASSSVIGIANTATAIAGDYITGNQIITLKNSAVTSSPVEVRGIYWNAPSPVITIEKNRVVDMQITSTSASSLLAGITTLGGNYNFYNNMISIGTVAGSINANPVIYGVYQSGGTVTAYYNSIRVMGVANTGSGISYAYYLASTLSLTSKDNILANERSTASAGNPKHYGIYFAGGYGYLGTNNNIYNTGTSGVLGFTGGTDRTDLTNWNAATLQDNPLGGATASVSISVTFTSATDLHIMDCAMASRGTTVAGVTADYDASTRNSTPWIGADEPFITWNGGVGNWNVAANWTPNIIPASYHDVVIGSGSVSLNADAVCHSITISAGVNVSANIYKLTLGASSCINSFFVNNGTFNANTGTVQFDGGNSILSGSISGTSATTFNNVTLNSGISFPASPLQSTVNSSLQLNSGSYVNANSPVYGTTSTLTYSTSGSYNVSQEWTSATDGVAASGRPNNVTIVNSTINMPNANRAMAGALTINLLGTLALNGTSGDLIIRGNWSDQGTFTPNNRAVFFTGLTDQTVTRVGGGSESFPYFCINKPNASTYVKPDNTAGNLTDLKITGTAGNVLQLLNNGTLDLNGRTVTLDGNNSISPTGYIYVNGARTITNSQGVNNGKFEIKSTANPNQPTWFTKSVANNSGVGTLTFDQNVLVTIADGKMDFGIGSLATVQGILQVNLGGSVYPFSCYYSASPASTLRFANTVDYQINAGDCTWGAGALYSGLAGIPYNVEINNAGTDLNVNTTRGVRNNLTITDGTLTLAMGIGNFNVGGNWTRTGVTSAFVYGNNTVVLDGNADQTITCTASGNKETFFGLDISNNDPTPEVILGGITSIEATFRLYLTSGIITTGSNEVYINNSYTGAITIQPSNSSANSWINGRLRRKCTIGNYDFPVGTSTMTSAAGYELIAVNFTSNSNVDNLLVAFTTDGSTTNEPYNVQVNGTWVVDRLNAGWWTIQPYNASFVLVASPICNYNVFLNERGHSNAQLFPQQYTVIKRDLSYCNDPCATAWTQCGTHINTTQTEIGNTAHAERSGFTCNSFSDWAIGFAPVVLPIELTTFNVTSNNGDAVLTWLTSAEYNSDFFAVERSHDGIGFIQIGTVKAAGYSAEPVNYSFTDHALHESGVNRIYYRLRMVDLDGSYDYSGVRWIDLDGTDVTDAVLLYPNPFTSEVSFQLISSAKGEGNVTVINELGQIIKVSNIIYDAGVNFFTLDKSGDFPKGIYVIKITCGKMTFISKATKL